MRADAKGMARLGLSPDSIIGPVAECGFDVFVRDDGLWGIGPDGAYDEQVSAYNQYLHSKGYEGKTRGMILRMQAWMQMGISPLAGYIITAICQPISARKISERLGLRARR